jgi:hypothetical protein
MLATFVILVISAWIGLLRKKIHSGIRLDRPLDSGEVR